ncbi:hypothetical protein GWK08_13400 [Leptobacterium flavescens]|uniref:Uncharacterized protein n=1 Tax=Leptobacterium flavescens TaxID=472055 RepID=A0A6P0UMH8_9FLAO|nr:hypothetical protein [Leptobacterium flavescens]NER14444.1 hypothetical protein [Leptobacterium flavescens]
MKNFALTTLVMLFTTISVLAQQPPLSATNGAASRNQFDLKREYLEAFQHNRQIAAGEDVNGSPYILENFITAKINHFKDVHLVRYNASTDDMEFKNSKDQILVLNKSNDYVISFTHPKKVYHSVTYGDDTRGFAELLWESSDSKSALYMRQQVEFIPKRAATNSYSSEKKAEYKKLKDVLFFKNSNGTMTEVPTNKKKFFSIFEGKEKEVQQFAKKNKLKINKESDIIKILDFYTS